jgi:hypothetical protein
MSSETDAFWRGFAQVGLALLTGAVVVKVAESIASTPTVRAPRRRPVEDPEHKVIRRLAEAHLRQGAEVGADIAGWPKPRATHGRIADVHAVYSNGDEELIEVERIETADSWHARKQDEAFRRWEARPTLARRRYQKIVVGR